MTDGPVSIIILEDSQGDFELEKRELRRLNPAFAVRQAQNRAEFVSALQTEDPGLILLDYSLPGFDALAAIAIVRECRPGVPCIIVSGAIGEETAIEALKAGATDYVLKSHLNRLGSVIQRTLHEAEQEGKRREAEEALRLNEERFRLALEHTHLTAWECDRDLRLTWVFNPAAGYDTLDLIGKTPDELLGTESAVEIIALRREVLASGTAIRRTVRYRKNGGEEAYVDQMVKPRCNAQGEVIGLLGISLDVTDRVRAANRLRATLENLLAVVRHAEEPLMVVDTQGIIEAVSEKGERLLGYPDGALVGKSVESMVRFDSRVEMVLRLADLHKFAPRPALAALRIKKGDGNLEWFSVEASLTHGGTESEKYMVKFNRLDFTA